MTTKDKRSLLIIVGSIALLSFAAGFYAASLYAARIVAEAAR